MGGLVHVVPVVGYFVSMSRVHLFFLVALFVRGGNLCVVAPVHNTW